MTKIRCSMLYPTTVSNVINIAESSHNPYNSNIYCIIHISSLHKTENFDLLQCMSFLALEDPVSRVFIILQWVPLFWTSG